MNRIYLDNASTTKVDEQVFKAMEPYFCEIYANPSAIYKSSREAKNDLENFRNNAAEFLGADPSEIVFTSGGTESNNLAIKGVLDNYDKGRVITTAIEHPSVFKPINRFGDKGFDVVEIKSDSSGVIDPKQVEEVLTEDTVLVSIMYANNEIGTIQPIKKIGKIIRKWNEDHGANVVFHTDACQATSYLDMNVARLGVDLLTLNGSKIYAPKGVGLLYKSQEVDIMTQVQGGPQEHTFRGGTENLPGVAGLVEALKLVSKREATRQKKIRDIIIKELLEIEDSHLNGSQEKRLPNNVNISFDRVEGESLVLMLDERGIEVATGSACSSKSLKPSHVITEISGLEAAHQSIRITLGKYNTEEDAKKVIREVKIAVNKIREMSI